MKRVADIIADFVAGAGVDEVFMLPGGGAMYLVDAFGNHDRLRFVAMHNEQSVSIAAEAYGRVTGRFGVGLVTTGPGATNAVTGVVGAWIESTPLMMISGQVKRSDLKKEKPVRQSGVQEVDIVAMVGAHTKYAVTVEAPERILYHLQKALYLMQEGRKGPVWIDVPLDVQGAVVDEEALERFVPPETNTPCKADYGALIEMIQRAERPLILAGHGIRLAGAADLFAQTVRALGVPAVTTWNAMDLLAHDDPLFAGKVGVVALRYGNFAVQNCDLLIVIGSRLDNIVTAYNPQRFAKAAKKVVVDVDPAEIGRMEMPIERAYVCDAKRFLEGLLAYVKTPLPPKEAWLARCAHLKSRYGLQKEFDFSGEMSHFEFAHILAEGLKGGEVISTGSSGLGIEIFYTAFAQKAGQRIFLTSGLGAMGYGLPAAIGACVGNGRRPIVSVESDGSLQLNIQELAVLKGQNLPVAMFVLDNGGYASIRNTQRNYFEGRYVATGPEGNLHLPDIARVCAAYGIACMTVAGREELKSAVKKALRVDGPLVVVVKLPKDETLRPKCSAVVRAETIYSMPLEDMSPLLPIEELEASLVHRPDPLSYEARGM